jgi:hypothetical protein
MTSLPASVSRRVRNEGDCIMWLGARNNRGYGSVGIGGNRSALVHRYVYEQMVGPIAEGMTIDHLCMNKLCVNVEHLEVVTRSENSKRAHRARHPVEHLPAGDGFGDIIDRYFGHLLDRRT